MTGANARASSAARTSSTARTPAPGDDVVIRAARTADGAEMWRIARDSGGLELNSCYAYLALCRDFGATCAIAEQHGRTIGFVLAYRPSAQPDAVFVWQIGVDAQMRGRGLASRLLRELVQLPGCRGVRYLETTVTPSNGASLALFSSFARSLRVPIERAGGFGAELFTHEDHEPEDRYRIGPFAGEMT
jgi:L-2,4-diaminobutyric acid acetyltransferase